MRVVISAGGTGGHINPAVAVGKYILKADPDNKVLFIGSDGDLEKRLYQNTGADYSLYKAKGLERKKIYKNAKILYTDFKAYKDIYKKLEEFKPDAGISFGGYISFMAMASMKKLKKPFMIAEQNAYPGLTTRILSKDARKYCLAFMKANEFLKYPRRGILTGNPVRSDFFLKSKEEAKRDLGIAPSKKMILCFGGSLGALKLNEAFFEFANKISDNDNILLYIGTGQRYYNDFKDKVNNENVVVKEYIDNMTDVLTACDIAVTRAGAMTVSELCALEKPSVLIPSPNVTADHQTKNARVLEEAGGAVLINESELDSKKFSELLLALVNDDDKLNKMSESLKPLKIVDGDKRIYTALEKMVK